VGKEKKSCKAKKRTNFRKKPQGQQQEVKRKGPLGGAGSGGKERSRKGTDEKKMPRCRGKVVKRKKKRRKGGTAPLKTTAKAIPRGGRSNYKRKLGEKKGSSGRVLI